MVIHKEYQFNSTITYSETLQVKFIRVERVEVQIKNHFLNQPDLNKKGIKVKAKGLSGRPSQLGNHISGYLRMLMIVNK